MHDAIVRLLAVISTVLIAAIFVSCGTDEPADLLPADGSGIGAGVASRPLDPATATLEQILERARVAMSEVTSYRSVTLLANDMSEPNSASNARITTEWKVPGHYRVVADGTDQDGKPIVNESILFTDEGYTREGESGWIQQRYESGPPRFASQLPTENPLLNLLNTEGLGLVSFDEVTDDGIPVYRLEAVVLKEPFQQGSGNTAGVNPYTTKTHTTLQIDHESFLLVTASVETLISDHSVTNSLPEPLNPNVQMPTVVSASVEGSGGTVAERFTFWSLTQSGSYEYNVPLTIVVPDEFEPWSEPSGGIVFGSTPRPPQAEHTPTATSAVGCSEQGAGWPICDFETIEEFEAMISEFPDDHVITVEEDYAITFAFEGPPNIDWQADGYVWHKPSGIFLSICVSNSPEPEIRFHGSGERTLKTNSSTSNVHFNTILAQKTVHDLITSRVFEVKGSCE